MEKTKEKGMLPALILAVTVLGAVFYSVNRLFFHGIFGWSFVLPEYRKMLLELFLLAGGFYLLLAFAPDQWKFCGFLSLFGAFLWIHQILLPILASGCYLGLICVIGAGVRRQTTGLLRNFLTGSAMVIVLFCVLSAFQIGNIRILWLVVCFAACLAVVVLLRGRRQYGSVGGNFRSFWKTDIDKIHRAAMISVILVFAIQAGRMNGAVDFDSLWYGVRSSRILDMGKGIYENPGMIGVVYTYSKGLETLTLPLSILPSYSFLISFNWWLAMLVLYGAYRLANWMMSRKMACYLVVFLAAVPAIMNMTVTAKTDIITLLLQLILIEELIRSRREEEAFGYALAAIFLSWTMKPTALLFSSAVFGMGVLGNLWDGVCVRKLHVRSWFLAFLTLIGIWARTFLITGVPVTSVFSSLFTRLGFTMNYPFGIQTIPNSGKESSLSLWLSDGVGRLWELLFAPQSEDMWHVMIAWGGLSLWFLWMLSAVCALSGKAGQKRTDGTMPEPKLQRWFLLVLLPFTAGNLLSLMMLTQVDGNYFVLLYVLWAVWGFSVLGQKDLRCFKRVAGALTAVVVLFGCVVMSITNWSGYQGFFPAKLLHRGYYDHQLVARDVFAAEGKGEIWEILAQNKRNRVIAIGSHPESFYLPCCVQSYEDVTGSQGNVVLVKTMNNFVEFLDYAKTDYVYIEAGYIQEGSRADTLTRDLVEYGILIPVCYENGNVLARVDVHGQKTEDSKEQLEQFCRNRLLQDSIIIAD